MSKLADTLYAARRQSGLSLEEVAHATRIPVATLQAIENDDFRRLPSTVYARGFVRNYAAFLNLDPDQMARLFDEAINYRPQTIRIATREPVIVDDFAQEKRFKVNPSLIEHNAVSGMSVRVGDADNPFGVLAAFARQRGRFTRDDAKDIQQLEDLHGKRVAVFKTGVAAESIARDHPEIQLYKADIAEEALNALNSGIVDAYVGNLIIVSHVARDQGLGNIKMAGSTPYSASFHMAVRSDWPELNIILQKTLADFSEEEHRAIRQHAIDTVTKSGFHARCTGRFNTDESGAIVTSKRDRILGALWILGRRKHAERDRRQGRPPLAAARRTGAQPGAGHRRGGGSRRRARRRRRTAQRPGGVDHGHRRRSQGAPRPQHRPPRRRPAAARARAGARDECCAREYRPGQAGCLHRAGRVPPRGPLGRPVDDPPMTDR